MKIIKFTNSNKPNIKESKNELIDKINTINIEINNKKNELMIINKANYNNKLKSLNISNLDKDKSKEIKKKIKKK